MGKKKIGKFTNSLFCLVFSAALFSCNSTARIQPDQTPHNPVQSDNLQRSVTQNGITWTFDRDYPVGQFYLGDWWVIGPVIISSVSPGWDGQRNGSMIDPDASTDTQGYRAGLDVQYVDSLNVATRLPLTIDPGQGSQGVVSLISSIGLDSIGIGGTHEGIRSAAVLTVVSGTPPSDAFRPAYARGDKTIYRTSQMNTNLLPGLRAPGSISEALSQYGNDFTKVYLDHASHGGNWGASMHPVENGLPYGRDFSTGVSNATLIALTNNGKAVEFARRLTQMGIDFYPMWLVNHKGIEGGGFGWGYKWTILFAGIMLNNDGMMHPPLYRTGTINKFPEDRWTSYGAPTPQWPQGKPLWGLVDPDYSNDCPPDLVANTDSTCPGAGYRICCSSFAWVGQALAARLMGAAGLWNHPAYFDYVDRWVSEPDSWQYGDTGNYGAIYGFGGQFVRDMWGTYKTSIAKPRK